MTTRHGAVSFIELGVGDSAAGRAFYEGLFGWGFETGPSGNGWMLRTPNLEGGMHPNDAGGGPYLFFAVEDMDAAIARVVELGGEILPDMGGDESEACGAQVRALQVLQGRPGLAVRAPPAAWLMARVVRHESERDIWEMVHGAPDPRLGGYVLDYCAYDERTGSFTRRRELPSERVVTIVNLGAPIRVLTPTDGWTDQPDGFFAGLHDTFALTETVRRATRRPDRPLAGRGAPAAADADARARGARGAAPALLGRAGTLLHEALACAGGWEERFALLDDFFLARLDDALSPVPSVTRALGRLRASGGTARVWSWRPRSGAAAGIWPPASTSRSASRRSCSGASCASSARSAWWDQVPAGPRSPPPAATTTRRTWSATSTSSRALRRASSPAAGCRTAGASSATDAAAAEGDGRAQGPPSASTSAPARRRCRRA